jgi:DsbC/DsbD-like thiol-disulfide interchange protein
VTAAMISAGTSTSARQHMPTRFAGPMLRRIAPVPLALLISLSGNARASAQDASDWDAQAHTAVRLIAGGTGRTHDTTFLRAGIEVRLEPGWKTYWRDPGDSGAPPIFDSSASENVKSVSVLWPAPRRFPDGAGGNSIGYTDHVILPLHVVPADNAKQTALRLKFDYDICANICIPVEANLALRLNGDGAEDAAIERAEIRVPRHVPLGHGAVAPTALGQTSDGAASRGQDTQDPGTEQDRQANALAILAVHRESQGAQDRVVVDVAAPPGAPVDLFAEGPTADWALPLPEQVAANGGVRQFTFNLDGLPPGAKPQGAALTLTAVSGDDAIEVITPLD